MTTSSSATDQVNFIDRQPVDKIVFDAVTKPETTPLPALTRKHGCGIVRGREMMRTQISRMVDYFSA